MKQALIVVDYQNDFVTGSLGFPGAEALDGPICEKIRAARVAGADVLFTLDTHGSDYLDCMEGKCIPIPHCIEDTDGWRLYGGVAGEISTADAVFIKHTYGSLALAEHLSERQYDRIELCGLVTDICVLSNAVLARAACPEAEIVVDARAVSSADRAAHEPGAGRAGTDLCHRRQSRLTTVPCMTERPGASRL